jgi:hypothetical protein
VKTWFSSSALESSTRNPAITAIAVNKARGSAARASRCMSSQR